MTELYKLISLKKSSRNFNGDISCLVLTFVAFAISGAGLNADSNVASHIGILSKILTGNNLLLKLLRTFSLELKNNPKLLKKDLFPIVFIPLSSFFDLETK